jgi:xylulokinase
VILAGFDVGTTAVKGIYFDGDQGRVVAESSWPYELHRPRHGHAEQDPHDFLAGLQACRRELDRDAAGAPIAAIGICSQVNTHVFVGDDLAPLHPAISWQDQRCADAARELDARAGEDKERIFGGPFSVDASYALSRARWLQVTRPEVWAATRWILSPKDFCIAALTGAVQSDRISPVGLVGADGHYLALALALVEGAAERLPPLHEFDATAGITTGALGFPAGVPVCVGTMDAWSSIYGSGVVHPGQGVHISGTSEVVGVMAAQPGSAEGVISFLPVRDRHLHAGGTQAGGDALRWVASLLGTDVHGALAAAEIVEPQPLVFLPHLAGERAPLWNSDARGVFLGMTTTTEPGHVVRAVLEGVAHSARHLRERCEEAAGFRAQTLRLSGGGAGSALWNQIKADAHRCTLEQVSSTMTGCLGAALMAGVAAGATDDLESYAAAAVTISGEYRPNAAAADRLDVLYAVYRATYRALEEQFLSLRRSEPTAERPFS